MNPFVSWFLNKLQIRQPSSSLTGSSRTWYRDGSVASGFKRFYSMKQSLDFLFFHPSIFYDQFSQFNWQECLWIVDWIWIVECPEKTHKRRRCKLHTDRPEPRFEPQTFLLWGDSANHRTTMPPLFFFIFFLNSSTQSVWVVCCLGSSWNLSVWFILEALAGPFHVLDLVCTYVNVTFLVVYTTLHTILHFGQQGPGVHMFS